MVSSLLKRERSLKRRRLGPRRAALGAILLILVTAAAHAPAQVVTWNNPADGNWSIGSNWVGGAAPTSAASTALVFGSPATQSATYTATNDIANPFQLDSLTVNNTAGAVTLNGSGLSFVGANSALTQSGAGAAIINSPMTLATTTTVAGTGTGSVTFNGAVNGGTNNLVKTSAGCLTLAGGGSLNVLQLTAGTTNVTGGTLALTLSNNTAASLLLGTAAGQTVVLNHTGGRINFTENARIGETTGSTATVNVTGAGAVLDNTLAGQTGQMRVGNNGAGALNVSAGGVVNSRNLYIGASAGGVGDMVIDGTGSTVNSSSMFRVGNAGNGTLNVRNGGTLNAGTVNRNFALIVGNIGVGTLTVRDGGTVNSPVAYVGYGGDGPTGTGTVTVTGANSNFTVGTPTTAGELGVGITELGTGTFNVQNGAQVTVHGNLLTSYFGGVGVINVTDAVSRIQVSGQLYHGQATDGGSGTLNVGAGGTVTVAGRANIWAAGTINLNEGGALSLLALNDGSPTSFGTVNLAAGTTLTLTDGDGNNFKGVIGGAGSLLKQGAGAQLLSGANTYSGTTTVANGTLQLTGIGSFAASPRIAVETGAILDVTGVTGGANFSSGGFALAANQTLTGGGSVAGPVTVVSNSAVAPGADGIGQLNLGSSNWTGGGRYLFEFNSLTPGPGTTNDFINGAGALNLTATAGNPFIIDVRGINFSSPGATPVGYTIATFSGGVSGFNPAAFAFPSTGSFADTPTIALQGNNLVLTFTPVPEPGTWLLLVGGLLASLRFATRRSACVVRSTS